VSNKIVAIRRAALERERAALPAGAANALREYLRA
jgi:hypothetical protein